MAKIAFPVYFSLVQAFGLLAAVVGDGQLSLLGPELRICYRQRQGEGQPDAAASSHHSDGHSHHHSIGSVPEPPPARASSDKGQIPFIHCTPISVNSVRSDLTLPSELPEPAVRPQSLIRGPRLTHPAPRWPTRSIQLAARPPRHPALRG